VVYYWYTGGAWLVQKSLESLIRFGQMWSDAVISCTACRKAYNQRQLFFLGLQFGPIQ